MDDTQVICAESAILSRVIVPGNGSISGEAARLLADLRFDDADVAKMNELAEKNRRGEATEAELAEMEGYSRVGSLLNLLQSKARRSLGNE